jgi:hypothetical protein
MSMETHVFFRGKLPTKAALSRTMKELGFPFSITPSTGSLERQSGFMPMKRRGEETGVEFDIYSDHAAVEEFADVGVDAGFERRASLRWDGDFQEAVAGMSAAAALAKLMNGVVFDEAEDKLLSADDAIALARRNLQELVKPEDVKHPGTRPADLKRYLKPLLKQRSDLVLIGRLLLIRPVRHIVRGVFFDRTSDKYAFKIHVILRLLVQPGERMFLGGEVNIDHCRVWDPEFPALLFHVLDQDVFSKLANPRRLADVDRDLGRIGEWGIADFHATVDALILAGRRERASELIDSFEAQPGNKERWQTLVRNQRSLLDQDAASLGAAFRLQEEKVAKVHRLGDAWEPSPFPIEVPEDERAQRCDEPPFPARPWIVPPPGLVNTPPTQPGEIACASRVAPAPERPGPGRRADPRGSRGEASHAPGLCACRAPPRREPAYRASSYGMESARLRADAKFVPAFSCGVARPGGTFFVRLDPRGDRAATRAANVVDRSLSYVRPWHHLANT